MPRASSSLGFTAALAAVLCGGAAYGQAPSVPTSVQSTPNTSSAALNLALARIAANPRDTNALLEAGTAALAMGDAEAAIGFFTRADQLEPGNARAKAGLAGAYVRNEDPFTAIRLFGEAERSGPLSAALLADRGLAYDLVGDNASAQRFYRQAGPANDEALRRLSLSLAITGDKRGSESALSPLLARQDRSAWRTRAFALAILGETNQAVSIANAMMPAGMAAAISPYLRYMRQLTPAQQAAAANLGHFPRASEIGRDDPRLAQYAPAVVRPAAIGADAGLVPKGEPLGSKSRDAQRLARQDRERDRKGGRERERPPEPIVGVSTTTPALVAGTTAAPPSRPAAATAPGLALAPAVRTPPARPAPPPAAPPTSAPARVSPAAATPATAPVGARPVVGPPAPPPEPATSAATASAPVTGPSFTLLPSATAAANAASQVAIAADAPTVPAAAKPIRLADAFSEFGRPTVDAAPAPGAVDVRKLAASRPAELKPAKATAPAQPSRIWVQVATGRDKAALAGDWRKLVREDAAVFRGKKPYLAGWGQTNRLLTGPFETEAAANAFVTQLRRADVDGAFLWTSPAGQVVDALSGIRVTEAARPEPETSATRRGRSRTEADQPASRRAANRGEPQAVSTRGSTNRSGGTSAKRRSDEDEPTATPRTRGRSTEGKATSSARPKGRAAAEEATTSRPTKSRR